MHLKAIILLTWLLSFSQLCLPQAAQTHDFLWILATLSSVPSTEQKGLLLTKWATLPLARSSSTLSLRDLLPAEVPRNVALLCRMDTPAVPFIRGAGWAGWLATKGYVQAWLPFSSGFHMCIRIHIYIATTISCIQKSDGKQQITLEVLPFC